MLILKAQRAPWHIREVNGKYLVMATGKNALSTLHENILAMATGNIVLSTLHEIFWPLQWRKGIAGKCHVVTTRRQICNQLPREKMRSHLICLLFVVRKLSFVFVFAFVILFFWREGRGPKKNDILEKRRGGGTKCGY